VQKYRNGKIKSVIHFRRIMESYDLSEGEPDNRAAVLRRVEEFFLNPALETRAAFDEFIVQKKRVQTAIAACSEFMDQLRKLRLRYTGDDEDRRTLCDALRQVEAYCKSLADTLEGRDEPETIHR
jgi:hypothetical protein